MPEDSITEVKQPAVWEVLVWAVSIAVSFQWIEPVFHAFGNLDSRFYEQNSILSFAVFNLRAFVITAVLLLSFALWQLRLKWQDLGPIGRRLRFPATAIVGCLGWALLTAESNYWWGHDYWFERILVTCLGGLVLIRPAFMGAFLLVAYMLTGQYNEPFLYSWTDKLVIFHLGLVIFLYLVWRCFSFGRATPSSAFMVLLAVLGQWYVVPAVGKINIGWMSENNVSHLLSSSGHQNGWLSWLSPSTFEQLRQTVEISSPYLMASALAIELSVVFFLFSRRLSLVLLTCCAGLHVGIFLSSGIFFWKWIAIEVALIAGLSQIPKAFQSQLFGFRQALITGSLMCLMGYFSPRVVNLAWYDEPCVYRFRFEATGQSGKQYEVVAADFAPYDLPFAQARFYFLTQRRQLVGTFGTTQLAEVHEFFKRPWNVQIRQVEQLVDSHGLEQYSPEQVVRMEEFLRKYMISTRERAAMHTSYPRPFGIIAAPQHILTAQRVDANLPRYRQQEPLREINVFLDEWLLGGPLEQLVHQAHVLAAPIDAPAQRYARQEVFLETHR